MRARLSPVDTVIGVFILGWVGLLIQERPDDLIGHLQVLTRSGGLFSFGNQDLMSLENPLLTLATVLAPLVGLRAALSVTRDLWIDRLDSWRISRFRGHSVVVGLGWSGLSVAIGQRKGSRPVAALERFAAAPGVADARAHGIRVRIGDAADENVLSQVRVDRAQVVWVFAGDDESAVQVLDAIRRANSRRSAYTLRAYISIEDARLRHQLQRREFVLADGLLDVVFVSIACVAADLGMKTVLSSPARHNVLTLGDGPFLTAISELGEQYSQSGQGLSGLSLVGERGSVVDSSRELIEIDYAELHCIEDDALFRERILGLGRTTPDACLVSFRSNAMTRAWTLRLASLSDALGVLVVGVLREPVAGSGDEGIGEPSSTVRLLDAPAILAAGTYAPQESWAEPLARILHARYLKQAADEGWPPSPAMVPWDALPDHYKDANRSQARGFPHVLATIGGVIEAAGRPAVELEPSEDELERLAAAEHERWMAERRRNWSRLDDALRAKAERLMRPYDDLTDTEKSKDREAVRTILHQLAQMGYRVTLRDDR